VTPKLQTRFGREKGNCFEACIASVLEIPIDVIPVLSQYLDSDWWRELRSWMHARGWTLLAIDYPNQSGPDPSMCIAIGKSPRGSHRHAVVWSSDRIVHDPFPQGGGLDGDPEYLVYLVPVNPARRIIRFNTDTGEAS